jgi:hypothetical protein
MPAGADPWGRATGEAAPARYGAGRMLAADVQRLVDGLANLVDRIESGAQFVSRAEAEYVEAKMTYEMRHAKATIAAHGTNAEVRRAQALLACAEEYRDLLIAEQKVKTASQMLYAFREQLRALQSISAVIRDSTTG